MKKIILSVAAIMAFGFANAQDAKFGIKGGMNLSTLTGDIEDPSSKVGFHVGGFAEIKLSEKFAVQPELLYSTQGAKEKGEFEYEGNVYDAEIDYKLAYINLPIMAKYYIVDKFNVEAGPQIGFLVSAKAEATVLGNSAEEDVKDSFKSVDFGLNLGAGYDFTDKFSAGARYNIGLSNMIDGEAADYVKAHNGVFSLSVGYKF
ncbi:porin family protein [Flavobacterium denitrificans]|uniref:porin family protein n=1 Tax=Flavobacterium denitrificans TaxID=281361 RepID=UPI00040EF6F6|nr:porin family protein [Flavobacterium denitrificans]